MDLNTQVGETAGKVWHALASARAADAGPTQEEAQRAGELLGFGLGWLAREDKIEIVPEKKSFRVRLKQG
jgi:hypothetical protein